ncbi:MAG: YceI family protein [bacterium]
MLKRALAVGAALLFCAPLFAGASMALPLGTYHVDTAHTTLGFEVAHLVIGRVNGKFDSFNGTIVVKSRHRISIQGHADALSVDTGNVMRDAHLKGTDPSKPNNDFFYAVKYPTLTFKSTKVTLNGTDLSVTGDLTIRGVTKTVTFTGQYNGSVQAFGTTQIAADLETTITRQDFGLKFNALIEAGPVVGDKVKIELDVTAVKKG